MHVVDYSSLAHSDWATRYMSKPVLLKGGLKRRPGIGKRRRCKVMTSFKNTIIFQTKLAKRLAIYEEMKLRARGINVELITPTTVKTNEEFIITLPGTDTKSGTLSFCQPKARDVTVQSIINDLEETARCVWHETVSASVLNKE